MRKFALIAGGAIAAACALAPTAHANTYADDYLEEVGLSIEFSAPLPAARLLQIGNQVCIDFALPGQYAGAGRMPFDATVAHGLLTAHERHAG